MGWASGFQAGSSMAKQALEAYRQGVAAQQIRDLNAAKVEQIGYTPEQQAQLYAKSATALPTHTFVDAPPPLLETQPEDLRTAQSFLNKAPGGWRALTAGERERAANASKPMAMLDRHMGNPEVNPGDQRDYLAPKLPPGVQLDPKIPEHHYTEAGNLSTLGVENAKQRGVSAALTAKALLSLPLEEQEAAREPIIVTGGPLGQLSGSQYVPDQTWDPDLPATHSGDAISQAQAMADQDNELIINPNAQRDHRAAWDAGRDARMATSKAAWEAKNAPEIAAITAANLSLKGDLAAKKLGYTYFGKDYGDKAPTPEQMTLAMLNKKADIYDNNQMPELGASTRSQAMQLSNQLTTQDLAQRMFDLSQSGQVFNQNMSEKREVREAATHAAAMAPILALKSVDKAFADWLKGAGAGSTVKQRADQYMTLAEGSLTPRDLQALKGSFDKGQLEGMVLKGAVLSQAVSNGLQSGLDAGVEAWSKHDSERDYAVLRGPDDKISLSIRPEGGLTDAKPFIKVFPSEKAATEYLLTLTHPSGAIAAMLELAKIEYYKAGTPKAGTPKTPIASDEAVKKALEQGRAKGTDRIVDTHGRGAPNRDTVPAMLAEGEAVLNAGAAELMGRAAIRKLNREGLRNMPRIEDAPADGRVHAAGGMDAQEVLRRAEQARRVDAANRAAKIAAVTEPLTEKGPRFGRVAKGAGVLGAVATGGDMYQNLAASSAYRNAPDTPLGDAWAQGARDVGMPALTGLLSLGGGAGGSLLGPGGTFGGALAGGALGEYINSRVNDQSEGLRAWSAKQPQPETYPVVQYASTPRPTPAKGTPSGVSRLESLLTSPQGAIEARNNLMKAQADQPNIDFSPYINRVDAVLAGFDKARRIDDPTLIKARELGNNVLGPEGGQRLLDRMFTDREILANRLAKEGDNDAANRVRYTPFDQKDIEASLNAMRVGKAIQDGDRTAQWGGYGAVIGGAAASPAAKGLLSLLGRKPIGAINAGKSFVSMGLGAGGGGLLGATKGFEHSSYGAHQDTPLIDLSNARLSPEGDAMLFPGGGRLVERDIDAAGLRMQFEEMQRRRKAAAMELAAKAPKP